MDDGFLRPDRGSNVVSIHTHLPPLTKPTAVPEELKSVPRAFFTLPLDVLMWLSVQADIAAQANDVEVIVFIPTNEPLETFRFLARTPQRAAAQKGPQSHVITVDQLEFLVSYHHEVLGRKRNQNAEEERFAKLAEPPFPQA